jgi:hypothetical protein
MPMIAAEAPEAATIVVGKVSDSAVMVKQIIFEIQVLPEASVA